QYAHGKGFIHRDLKPLNILVLSDGDQDRIKILDFGLVGLLDPDGQVFKTLTSSSDIIGSVCYSAPEAFQSTRTSEALDIYSIGCIFYEMLSGSPPYYADNPVAVMHKAMHEPLPSLPESAADSPYRSRLDRFIARACAKSTEQRFRSVEQMLTA